jgi:hypothetical protein
MLYHLALTAALPSFEARAALLVAAVVCFVAAAYRVTQRRHD